MSFKPGQTGSKKGRSGRKSKSEEIAAAIGLITNEMLIELAKKKVLDQMKEKSNEYNRAKDFSLPVVLRQMKEIKELNVKLPVPLDGMTDIISNVSQDKR